MTRNKKTKRKKKTSNEVSGTLRAKLFKHGGSQAVRLPKEFRFSGTEVRVHREGERVVLEPTAGWPAGYRETLEKNAHLFKDLELPADPPPEPLEDVS
ncbi:MAG: antitoxin [Myxococcaceae bacterium]